jgi:ABC-type spermidine/putrescine transport system permease subunit I
MTQRPFLRLFVSPAALCAFGFLAALAAVMQYSLRAYVPGSLEAGGFTLENFTALAKPLYARVFLDTVWICFLTAFFTLLVGYPLAYALVHARNVALKSAILVITVTPLFLGEVVRTYSWIVVLGNNGFLNSMLLKSGLIDAPVQFMFTHFGVVTALVHVTLPVMVIMLAAALSHIDRDYERSAASLGAGPDPRLSHGDAAALHPRHHRRRHHRLRLDLQRLRDPAADWRRASEHGRQSRLSAGSCELQFPVCGEPVGRGPGPHLGRTRSRAPRHKAA